MTIWTCFYIFLFAFFLFLTLKFFNCFIVFVNCFVQIFDALHCVMWFVIATGIGYVTKIANNYSFGTIVLDMINHCFFIHDLIIVTIFWTFDHNRFLSTFIFKMIDYSLIVLLIIIISKAWMFKLKCFLNYIY